MKVLVVTDQLIKESGDSFYCIQNFYDILKRFGQLGDLFLCGHRYSGISSNTMESNLTDLVDRQNIFYITKTYSISSRKTKKTIAECVKRVDLVIGYLPSINAATACSIAKKYGKRFMGYVVGCPWDAFWNHGFLGKFVAPYAYYRMRKTLSRADYALYVTDNFLQKRYPCSGITCGCSDVKITSLDEAVLERRLLCLNRLQNTDCLNVVTIANNSVKYKGQHFVIKALAELKKLGKLKFHYYLIGGGDKTRLENLSKRLNVESNVHFLGMVPHSKIFEALDGMHVYIQPSLQEGLPRSVVEAMSRGLLCICANTAAMPEMVEPRFVVRRKSVTDIVKVLQGLSKEDFYVEAKRNFCESQKYVEEKLIEKRKSFFDVVKNSLENRYV